VMHACGHDVHTTTLLATSALLAELRDQWRGTVIALAQPAEELGRGADLMIRDGLFTRFPKPDACVALHVAARMEGRRVDPRRLRLDYETGSRDGRQWIVETAGGLLTPLTDAGPLFGDLLVDLALPCLLVAPSGLDALNHTLLTLEAMRSRGLEPAGVVLNGPPDAENRRAVETFGEIEVIAELPLLAPLDREAVERAAGELDAEGRLERYLSPDIRG